MATLILSTVGTAVGGPVGGAIGTLLGRAIDSAIIPRPSREGPRLTELAVTTSSYGLPVPRVFGTMRLPGTIVWATDLVESSTTSGGKGKPSTTTYSYSISFAVALSSRPVASVGRIWADGALLRGAAGDLKVGGAMRLSPGLGDAPVDPLIAADKGGLACAFRGLAYVVFEDLELASFGNRIPALSFEVVAPDGALDIVDLLPEADLAPGSSVTLTGLGGYADGGGPRTALLEEIGRIFPFSATTVEGRVALTPHASIPSGHLSAPISGRADGEDRAEPIVNRDASDARLPGALRYYDPARDFQPSLQRASGAASADSEVIEFAGMFAAPMAQARIDHVRRAALRAHETLSYRIAEPMGDAAPGRCVLRDGDARVWRVMRSEWHADGVDLVLQRVVQAASGMPTADPGGSLPPEDVLPGDLVLRYFELPWDGTGASNVARRYAAVSMAGGRGGVALSGVEGDALVPLGLSADGSAVQGHSRLPLGPSAALLFEPGATLDIALSSARDRLQSIDMRALLDGANRLLLGEEIVQFLKAEPLGGTDWRLTGLLRGRGGTEHIAAAGHAAGTNAVLLDDRLLALGEVAFPEIAALSGLGNAAPTYAEVLGAGTGTRPLAPVHPGVRRTASGDPEWHWIRRARGAWRWADGLDVPLVEEREAYRVGFGPVDAPFAQWDIIAPRFGLPVSEWAALRRAHPAASLWVRQAGSHALSLPSHLPLPILSEIF
ncbi:GTA baseplate fiber-binding domain-containing protein [Alteriqipengyuania sp. 357]